LTVGLVLVSHSRELVFGLREMLRPLGGDSLRLAVVGGARDGSLGTDAIAIKEAVEAVAAEGGAVVLMDLGSAVMATEAALELLDPWVVERVRLADAPIVEGAVAAAVEAGMEDASVETVVRAAEAARGARKLG
jgi:dihydroxyacetone kinase phosphotransfer subunit